MNKVFKTVTFGNLPLKVNPEVSKFIKEKDTAEIKAEVNLETGAVRLFIDPEELKKLK
ncbi:hypothetical protein [Enterococcus casseliflavus]|uniref:Uncharacterized protein n=1 Tax=Enterococcus casseliflavus TaxID=37734 RepID=A0ABD5FP60_ENTCA|nr:hypothetical protein [Enterococcus casseliflavus]MDT2984041.1 hypothetical protein [Enterococcus casseliflavus]